VILSEIRSYLQRRGQASLSDMMVHFNTDPEALRPMLEVWVKKGQVERFSASPDCGGNCNLCAPEATELYRWRVPSSADQGPGHD
jgi:hypothetical protein